MASDAVTLEQDDIVFFRPRESEGVFLQSATLPSTRTARSSTLAHVRGRGVIGDGEMTAAGGAIDAKRPASRGGRAFWLVAAFSVAVGLYGLSYLVGHPPPPGPAANAARYPWLVIHAVSAGLALLIGPWQFFSAIRTRWPTVHRWTGRAYVTLCAIGGPAGLILAWNTSSGDVARYGFLTLAVLWMATTGMAYTRRGATSSPTAPG